MPNVMVALPNISSFQDAYAKVNTSYANFYDTLIHKVIMSYLKYY